MSLLEQVKEMFESVVGGKMTDDHTRLVSEFLASLTSGQSGGLQGLIRSFEDKGLGNIVSSWVGTGSSLPITAEQVETGLGKERIQQLASKVGLSTDTTKSALASLLPMLVDRLTPDGKVPDASQLQQYLDKFKGKLPAKAAKA